MSCAQPRRPQGRHRAQGGGIVEAGDGDPAIRARTAIGTVRRRLLASKIVSARAFDFLCEIAGKTPVVPIPTFEDAYQTQRVLEAALLSATEKRWINMDDVK